MAEIEHKFTAVVETLHGMPSIKMGHFVSLMLMTINCKIIFLLAGNHLFTGINIGRSVIYRWVAADLSSKTPLQTSPNVNVLKGIEFFIINFLTTIYYIFCVLK